MERIPTFAALLGGVWVLLIGLLGLIRKKKDKNISSE
jgi:LPXTG-motif cell wall-anchored protein